MTQTELEQLSRDVAAKRGCDANDLKQALDYNHETGVFTWKQNSRRTLSGDVAGTKNAKYIQIKFKQKIYQAHRLAWIYVHGVNPIGEIDHINGNTKDNRIANLRDLNRQQNAWNQRAAPNHNTTGFFGVTFEKRRNKYRAQIRINGKGKSLGYYKTPGQAHQAYIEAKRVLHESCTI